mmetsp:Transcript_19122/g.31285  ORF Transcript_19122/g.31285 Transcript_19122/m.31285 type:complete len:358 (+) Transcript_19122:60-1133(+)
MWTNSPKNSDEQGQKSTSLVRLAAKSPSCFLSVISASTLTLFFIVLTFLALLVSLPQLIPSFNFGSEALATLQTDCQTDLSKGQWFATPSSSEVTWKWDQQVQERCDFRFYEKSDLVASVEGKRILFIGDSNIRILFSNLLCLVSGKTLCQQNQKLSPTFVKNATYGSVNLEYGWAQFAVNVSSYLSSLSEMSPEIMPDILVLGTAAWDAKYGPKVFNVAPNETEYFRHELSKIRDGIQRLVRTKGSTGKQLMLVWQTPTFLHGSIFKKQDPAGLYPWFPERNEQLAKVISASGLLAPQGPCIVLDFHSFTRPRPDLTRSNHDTVHYKDPLYELGIQILANGIYKSQIWSGNVTKII